MLTVILLAKIVAILLVFQSIYITFNTRFNMGNLLVYIATVLIFLCGFFSHFVNNFIHTPAGFIIFVVCAACFGIFLILCLFIVLNGINNKPDGTQKTMIILGAKIKKNKVSDILRRRLQAALKLWKQHPNMLIVVSGGKGIDEPTSEAAAMKKWLQAEGVPKDAILLEDKSTTTQENMSLSKEQLLKNHVDINQPIVIVTNTFHCYRAVCYAKKSGFTQVRQLNAPTGLLIVLPMYLREILAIIGLWFQH